MGDATRRLVDDSVLKANAPAAATVGQRTVGKRTAGQTTSRQRTSRQKTFRRGALERAFVEFCQLSTEAPAGVQADAAYEQLCQQVSGFIDNPAFHLPSAEREILQDDFLSKCAPSAPKRSSKRVVLPTHLASMCEESLLTPEQERQLFQRMNFLRSRAHHILTRLSQETLDQWDVERIRGLVRAADWYRDCIVQANIRLVISVVKKFANPQCSFDDLLSDGIMALMRAVDKFDFELGFRFSTYATQVVRRNSYRYVMERQDERFKFSNSLNEQGLDFPEENEPSSLTEQRWHDLREQLRDFLDKLDRREKFIIRARFSLGGHRRVQTLQKLADRLQISKERVRQLEKRAMQKLSSMAEQQASTSTTAKVETS